MNKKTCRVVSNLSWYEDSLPLMERKKRGHFSTPPQLVEQILDACGYTPAADLTRVRVLDPACGSGNFLAGAAQRLMAFGEYKGLSEENRISLVQHNIWGFDPDPVSCFLAEMQVRTILGYHTRGAPPARATPPPPRAGASPAPTIYGYTRVQLHVHQADSLALSWEPCVDLFLANPPYLAAKNTDLSGYRSAQQRGQADSYLLFLNLALQVVRPGGWIGLVLPDPVLARANATKERAFLLEKATLHHLWHLSGVFAADVGAVVIIAQKCSPVAMHQVSWVREKWQTGREPDTVGEPGGRPQGSPAPKSAVWLEEVLNGEPGGRPQGSPPLPATTPALTMIRLGSPAISGTANTISQSLFLQQSGAELRYLLSSERGAAIERLSVYLDENPGGERRFAPLEEFLCVSRGEEIGRESQYLVEFGGQAPASIPLRPPPGQGQARRGKPELLRYMECGCQPEYSGEANRRAYTGRCFGKSSSQAGRVPPARATQASSPRFPATPAPTGRGGFTKPISESDLCGRPYPTDWYPVLRGGVDIRPYSIPIASWQIARDVIAKPLERYLSPKLLVVKSTDRLQAALDIEGHVALQTLYLLHLRDKNESKDSLYFFLALLNSRLLRDYVYILHTAYKWVQPQIEQRVLARLPVPIVQSKERQQIIEKAKALERACSVGAIPCGRSDPVVEWNEHITRMYEEQECTICALYDAALPGLFADISTYPSCQRRWREARGIETRCAARADKSAVCTINRPLQAGRKEKE